MKYVHEYRARDSIEKIVAQITRVSSRRWTIMEVCGGQTHTIARYGLSQLLPDNVELVHGPGCPVCVTPLEVIDQALAIAATPGVIFCSFGDMLRVPGSARDLLAVKAAGGDVRTVYSPLQAVELARRYPDRQVVFFAIGFETTTPANAMAAYRARELGLKNFSMLVSQFLVPPAIREICSAPDCRVQAFMAAGHVCAVMGTRQYPPLVREFKVPIVVTGFEPLDILQGVLMCVQQLEEGRHEVQNQYARAVAEHGNLPAQQMLARVFEPASQNWRGIGYIPGSGLRLRAEFAELDASDRFRFTPRKPQQDCGGCISGELMRGLKKPGDCPHFGKRCRPEHPLGAPMVSAEGPCAAYYRYQKQVTEHES